MNKLIETLKHHTTQHSLLFFVVKVNPTLANMLLEYNKKNRKLSLTVVKKYAAEMTADSWELIETITFDYNGNLTDGQHRLYAVIESGSEVTFIVVWGVSPSAQKVIDRHFKRQLTQALMLEGVANNKFEVMIAGGFLLYEDMKQGKNAFAKRYDSAVENSLYNHLESIQYISSLVKTHNKGITRVGFLTAVTIYCEIDKDMATAFYNKVVTGEMLSMTDPAYKLRQYLIEGKTKNGGSASQAEDIRRTFYAISKFHKNEPVTRLYELEELSLKVITK